MFARVHRCRHIGAKVIEQLPIEKWQGGILEFSTARSELVDRGVRRLVLRSSNSNPTTGVIFELFEPRLTDIVDHGPTHYMIWRGIEPFRLSGGQTAAVVQDWLVVQIAT